MIFFLFQSMMDLYNERDTIKLNKRYFIFLTNRHQYFVRYFTPSVKKKLGKEVINKNRLSLKMSTL